MADLSQTAANVAISGATSATVRREYNFGATVVAGNSVYLDTNTNTWKLAQANAATGNLNSDTKGVALNGGASGQPAVVAVGESVGINLGATLVVGQTYVVSAGAAGAIAPISDLVSGNYPTLLGVAKSASLLYLQPLSAGVAKP